MTIALYIDTITVSGQEKETSCETEYIKTDKGSVCGAIEKTDSSKQYQAFYGRLISFEEAV